MKLHSPIFKRNLSKLAVVSLIWYCAALVILFIEKGILGELEYYPSTGNRFNFPEAILFRPVFYSIAGGLLGAIEIFWLNDRFRRNSLGKKILFKTFFYLLSIILLTFLGTAVANSVALKQPIFSDPVLSSVFNFFGDFAYISIICYIGFILLGTLFFLEVSDNLGQGVLINFIFGKYHKPREEERIFMFMDLKSSTTIAEKLGHVNYFSWLNDYYHDIAKPIITSYGTIHQYIGDEVVISWTKQEGLRDMNCIRCFFNCRERIAELSRAYERKYGIVPEFKAGLHLGKVTVGEIGTIKKEIMYTGDVLNTTSRIQGLCNTFGADTLISEDLLRALEGLDTAFRVHEIEEVSLRGRNQTVRVYGVEVAVP